MEQVFPAGMVNYHEGLMLEWKIGPSADAPEEEWIPIGETMHDIYVVHSQPEISFESDPYLGTQAFHSLVHLGCSNAQDESIKDEIVDAIYSDFMPDSPGETPAVYAYGRANPLTYYDRENLAPTTNNACWETWGLLQYQDGRCGAWADFFVDILRVQGIGYAQVIGIESDETQLTNFQSNLTSFFGDEETYVYGFGPSANQLIKGFFVKQWDVDMAGFYIAEQFSYPDILTDIVLPNENVIPWAETLGVAGQGNVNPLSDFSDHAIVWYDDPNSELPPYLYDPSYGSPKKPNLNGYESEAMAAFYYKFKYFKLRSDGMREEQHIIWVSEMNTSSPQLIIID